jgi:hypothetical protein
VAASPKLSCEVEKNLGSLRWKVGFWGAIAGGVLISSVPAQVVGSGAECDCDARWGGCGPRMDGGGIWSTEWTRRGFCIMGDTTSLVLHLGLCSNKEKI